MYNRTFISIALFFLLLAYGCDGKPPHYTTSMTVVSYGGGAYQQSHVDAFLKPFSDITGIRLESVAWNVEYQKLKTMVQDRNVVWDVVEVTDAEFKRGKRDSLYQSLTVLPSDGEFLPNTVEQYGVANVYWGTVLAYLPDTYPKRKPETWADFWDFKTFPGPRALYDNPRGNLEFALIADGVSKDNLYPLDVERAFKKLDQIKSHVRVWWSEGTQAVQLLQTKSVALTSAWNGRIFALSKEGTRIDYSWSGAALELDWWIIPRGSSNADAASRFIVFASLPERMARQSRLVGYGPINTSALDYVPDEIKQQLPTHKKNWEKSFVVDSEWWSKNEKQMMERWVSWKSK